MATVQPGGASEKAGPRQLTLALALLGLLVCLGAGSQLLPVQRANVQRELGRRLGRFGGNPLQLLPPAEPEASADSAAQPAFDFKVALLFLTRGDLPYEPLWRSFLDSATAALQQGAATCGSGDGPSGFLSRLLGSGTAACDWRQLFSIYTHPAIGHQHPAGSLFAGHEVPDRVYVAWGNHSMVEAERALLRAALADPRNQRFVLLSDSCIPLHSAPVVWTELMSESRSRTHFCGSGPEIAESTHQVHRWQAGMEQFGVKKEAWRKGSQWFMLMRKHAELVVNDTQINAAFAKECFATGWDPPPPPEFRRDCISDEHYIPTLLVLSGLEEQTNCQPITYLDWGPPPGGPHPLTFGAGEANPEMLARMRQGGANSSAALASASIHVIRRAWQGGRHSSAAAAEAHATAPAKSPDSTLSPVEYALSKELLGLAAQYLIPSGPLFARKLAPDPAAVAAWAALLQPTMIHTGSE